MLGVSHFFISGKWSSMDGSLEEQLLVQLPLDCCVPLHVLIKPRSIVQLLHIKQVAL